MNNKNSTQNVSIILDCISQSIGIEIPTAILLGGNPLVSGTSHLASCTIRSGGKYLIDKYMFRQTEHPYLFKMSSVMLGCAGGAIKYWLTGYYLASIPGVLPTLIITGCINNTLYELVSDMDEKYVTPIPIEVFEVITKPSLSRYFDPVNNMQLHNDEVHKGNNAGLAVFCFGQTLYPFVKENQNLGIDKFYKSFFKETKGICYIDNFLSCIQHPIINGIPRIENSSACIDVIKIVDYCLANFEDN